MFTHEQTDMYTSCVNETHGLLHRLADTTEQHFDIFVNTMNLSIAMGLLGSSIVMSVVIISLDNSLNLTQENTTS